MAYSEDSHSAPIYNVNDDVLLCIFTFNADMFSESYYWRALHTTRITSQVCCHWRGLIIRTPSLWARLIDMDRISNRKTDEWRNELIRRSGDAPLWIRATCIDGRFLTPGPLSPHEKYILQFFFKFVRSNWHRVQKFVLSANLESILNRLLCFPAPQLEHCKASFAWGRKADTISRPLFANHAPLLRSIYLSNSLVDQKAPWLCGLHSMVLNNTYSVSDALAILSVAHSLQELKIESISHYGTSSFLPVASLLHLKYVEYHGNSSAVAAFLGHIKIPVDCMLSIQVHISDVGTSLSPEKLHLFSIIDIFIRHAESTIRTFTHIDLDYQRRRHISLTCRGDLPGECLLSISIPLSGDFDSNLLETFLKKLIQLDLRSVVKLKFAAHRRLNPHFGLFFGCLPSVEIIHTNIGALSHLAHLQRKCISKNTQKLRIMFPVLEVIHLSLLSKCYSSLAFVNKVAAEFLLSRLREGHPITTLDISNHSALEEPPNLDALAEVKGLKVLYQLSAVDSIIEHTCGSENSDNSDTI